MRPTVMEIDVHKFLQNIEEIKKFLPDGVKIMPIIKANGYGTYINTRLDILNKFDIVAVANVDEGAFIRNLGYTKEIFILNQPYEDEIPEIIENDLTIGICCNSFVKKINELNENIKVHIEIGTGMGRTGINPKNIIEFLDSLNSNIKVEGIYTHLSSTDCDFEYTKKQLELFEKVVNIAKNKVSFKYIHSHASNGILNFSKVGNYNLVRPGMIIYGYPSDIETCKKINLNPIAKLKSKVNFLKVVSKGTSISYSRSFITTRETKVATIPIGYADGLRRSLSNKGEVVINGKKAKIIGNVCMDSIMVDVTDLEDVKVGDDVYIWDNENIKLEDIAKLCGTINYEILSGISSRVPRIFC